MFTRELQPDLEELHDEVLLSHFAATQDSEYFMEFHRRHSRKVFASCHAFFRNKADAEDATQETFFRAYKSARQFESGNPVAWLLTIARHHCVDRVRMARREVPYDGKEVPEQRQNDPLPDTAWRQVRDIVSTLPSDQRGCVELYLDDRSYQEIANQLGKSTEEVRTLLQKAKRTIRREIGVR